MVVEPLTLESTGHHGMHCTMALQPFTKSADAPMDLPAGVVNNDHAKEELMKSALQNSQKPRKGKGNTKKNTKKTSKTLETESAPAKDTTTYDDLESNFVKPCPHEIQSQ